MRELAAVQAVRDGREGSEEPGSPGAEPLFGWFWGFGVRFRPKGAKPPPGAARRQRGSPPGRENPGPGPPRG